MPKNLNYQVYINILGIFGVGVAYLISRNIVLLCKSQIFKKFHQDFPLILYIYPETWWSQWLEIRHWELACISSAHVTHVISLSIWLHSLIIFLELHLLQCLYPPEMFTDSWNFLCRVDIFYTRLLCLLHSFLRIIYIDRYIHSSWLNLKTFSSLYWDNYMVFILQLVNVVYHIDWLTYIRKCLHFWDRMTSFKDEFFLMF